MTRYEENFKQRFKDQVDTLEEQRVEISEKETLKPQSKKWWQLWK